MSEDDWRPIETAPVDTPVMMGSWWIYGKTREWMETSGIAFESRLFGLLKVKTHQGRANTHWQPLPNPPKE